MADFAVAGMVSAAASASPDVSPSASEAKGRSGISSTPLVPRLPCAIVQELATFHQEDGLCADFLKHYCGVEDLGLVMQLEIQVDSAKQSIEPLGDNLPNLRHLKLMDSSLLCIRDLGTSLRNLEVLWISRCGLQDIGGAASALPALRELYMPFNDINDLGPLAGHDVLEVLDLEGNAISDACEVGTLNSCPALRELTLSGNPVTRPGSGSLTRLGVIEMLPQLAVLDDLPTDPAACSSALSEALQRSAQEESTQPSARYSDEPDEDELVTERLKAPRPRANLPHAHTARPAVGGGWFQFQTFDRRQVWGSDSEPASFRPGTATGRPGTAGSRPGTAGGRPSTSSGFGPGAVNFEDMSTSRGSASDLTCGTDSLAGGAFALMRHRRQQAAAAGATGVSSEEKEDMDIRELLRRYQTFMQPSCLPMEERRSRKLEAAQRRPCTPDVRIHTPGQDRPRSSASRRGSLGHSDSGLSRRSSGRNDGGRDSVADDLSCLPNLRTATGEVLFLEAEGPKELE